MSLAKIISTEGHIVLDYFDPPGLLDESHIKCEPAVRRKMAADYLRRTANQFRQFPSNGEIVEWAPLRDGSQGRVLIGKRTAAALCEQVGQELIKLRRDGFISNPPELVQQIDWHAVQDSRKLGHRDAMYARCPRNLFGFINGGVIIKGTLRGEDEEGRLILDDQHEAATGIMPRMLGADHLKLPAMEQYARTCDWLAEVTERSSAIELDIIDPAITCDSCGACCQHMGYPPTSAIMDPEEWMALPDALRIEIHDAMHALRGDQELPCIWLDEQTKQCKHYEYRPSICRDFPVGGESCIRMRKDRV